METDRRRLTASDASASSAEGMVLPGVLRVVVGGSVQMGGVETAFWYIILARKAVSAYIMYCIYIYVCVCVKYQ